MASFLDSLSIEELIRIQGYLQAVHKKRDEVANNTIETLPSLVTEECNTTCCESRDDKIVCTSYVCVICQSNLESGETVVNMPCKHKFHKECLTPWFKCNLSCPTCRYAFDSPDISVEERWVRDLQLCLQAMSG